MIDLKVDESYAYDYLSIMNVKLCAKINRQIIADYNSCYSNISSQVGESTHDKIINSLEYKNLEIVNKKIFNAVDKAKKDEVKASIVDNLNYERYLCKKRLQKKFFNSEQNEIKIGY